MKSKKNRRSSMTFGEKMIFFAGVLFCLVLITTAMMGGLFARYTTIGSGSDEARVAKFSVNSEMNANQVDVVYSLERDGSEPSKGAYRIKVTSDSEVAVSYDVIVTLKEALPDGFSIALYQGANSKELTKKNDKKYQYTDSFAPGAGNQAEYELRFIADWSKVNFTETIEGKTATLEIPFDVDVTITQID